MKIIVNDNIIETTEIYKISQIDRSEDASALTFIIEFLNKTKLKIEHNTRTKYFEIIWADAAVCYFYNEDGSSYRFINNDICTILDCINSEEYKQSYKEISELRDKIVFIWSENQQVIPTFNL